MPSISYFYLLFIIQPLLQVTIYNSNLSIAHSIECNQDKDNNYDQIPDELDMDLRLLKHYMFNQNPDGTTKLINGGPIEDYISERFNKTLEGCDTVFNITQVKDVKYFWNHNFNVTLQLKSATKKQANQTQETNNNLGLLRGLNNIVNCSLGCDSRYDENVGAYYDYFIASDRMMDLWLDVKIFINQIKIKTKLSPILSNDTTTTATTTVGNYTVKCKLCDQIAHSLHLTKIDEDSKSSRSYMMDLSRIFNKLIAFAYSIMDPNHWIALIVGVWLITCFAVAMYRKRQDKRHLPEYLKQRENYSFSAKRNPNPTNT